MRTYVADALRRVGQPDKALPMYGTAAKEAEAENHWSDLAWITGSWSDACRQTGDLDKSQELRRRSAELKRRAGAPEVSPFVSGQIGSCRAPCAAHVSRMSYA